jgi:pimeloyl-ACP methyl ester carboxylesterase
MNALPLVLVPGLMCDHTVWEPLLPFMGASQTCQMIDHQSANSLSRMAEQLLEVSPPKFVMAGHSVGGRVALEVLRMAPDRVAGVASDGHGLPGQNLTVLPASLKSVKDWCC